MGAEETDQITLEDLLRDAATVLEKQEGLRGLARAVRLARAERGAIPEGEKWVADICALLDRVEEVIAAAHENPDAVDLTRMAEALEKVATWGLTPEHRMGNFLRHVIVRLENIRSAIEAQIDVGGRIEPEQTLVPITELLDELGFPRDGHATDS